MIKQVKKQITERILLLITAILLATSKVQAKGPATALELVYKQNAAETTVSVKIPMTPILIPLSGVGAYGAYTVWKRRECRKTYKKRNRPL